MTTDSKIKECIIVGLQLRHVINEERLKDMQVRTEKSAWKIIGIDMY